LDAWIAAINLYRFILLRYGHPQDQRDQHDQHLLDLESNSRILLQAVQQLYLALNNLSNADSSDLEVVLLKDLCNRVLEIGRQQCG